MATTHTHYDNLRVSRNAPPEVIRAAYKALTQRYHPDKSHSPDATRIMKILNEAYEVLSDSEKRRQYDESIERDARQSRATPQPETPSTGFTEQGRAEPSFRANHEDTTPPSDHPPTGATVDAGHPALMPMAGRWSRFFARSFDLWWEIAAVAFIGGYWLAQNSAWYVETMNGPSAKLYASVLFLPLALVLDAFVYRIFRNTPGKALLGLKVTTIDGSRLTFDAYLRRNFALWVSGLAVGLPLFNLGTMIRQSSRLGNAEQASYDESSGNRVRVSKSGILRKLLFAVAYVLVVGSLSIANRAAELSNATPRVPVGAPSVAWTNPVTGRSAMVEPIWTFAQQSHEGTPVYSFTEKTQHAAAYFAQENFPRTDLREYVNLYRQSVADTMRLNGYGSFADDGNFWQVDGELLKESLRVHVSIVRHGTSFWRIVEIQDKPYAFTDDRLTTLRTALWQTLR
ncbi:DnaJ domain-containing protein [Paraburkholderia sp. NPDC080076]|uniref:DnaJ domain-containing protein n=1 Tax=Paraburkholderia sp. NPDC080076 TaxID=3390605 RepID=UPI003D050168